MKSVRISLFILSAVFSVSVSAGDNIAIGFSPGESAQRLILNLIAGAGQTLDVAAYEFTSRPVAQALISQSQRGVAVRLSRMKRSVTTVIRWFSCWHAAGFRSGRTTATTSCTTSLLWQTE